MKTDHSETFTVHLVHPFGAAKDTLNLTFYGRESYEAWKPLLERIDVLFAQYKAEQQAASDRK